MERIRNQGSSSILCDMAQQNPNGQQVVTELNTIEDWDKVNQSVKSIIIAANSMNDENLKGLDFTDCKNLRLVTVGDDCFMHVNTLKLIGMKNLESVMIGKNCFTKERNKSGKDPKRHFELKSCPSLRELKVGRYSFSDYTVCEIDDVNALVTIEIGDLNADSYNFPFASLKLKGWWDAKGDYP